MQRALRVALIAALAVVSGCGTNGSAGMSSGAADAGSVVSQTPAPPTTTPMTPPPTATTVVSPNGISGETAIADNFDLNTFLESSVVEPPSPDPIGAFRFTCLAGQLAKDDPIVYPGQPGASHLHQFFGNTSTNANSNYTTLRTTGGSTCTRSTGTSPQRSAYWVPAMLDGAGNAVKPDLINTYYKRLPASDPACGAPDATHVGYCVGMPNGLRFVFGYNMATGAGGPTDANSGDYWAMGFECVANDNGVNGASYTGLKRTLADIVATGQCPVGAWLRMFATIPDCWDGKNLDTPDHRSHMAYEAGPAALSGKIACPADHPYMIPEIAIQAFYTVDANLVAGKWHLASDEMVPGAPAGKTLHMDYWEAWSPVVKDLWQTYCINGHLSCSSGTLGNGQDVKGMQQVGPYPSHVLVPLSSL
jgi:hypothetical protein